MESHGIGWAIEQLHGGCSVTRRGWNGPGQSLRIQNPSSTPDPPGVFPMTLPYIFIKSIHQLETGQGSLSCHGSRVQT